MIALFVALPLGAFLLGHKVGWHHQMWISLFGEPIWSDADRQSNRVPLPKERSKLTEPEPVPAGVDIVHIGARVESEPVRLVDEHGCSIPCPARHCAYHHAPGTDAQTGGWAHQRAVHLAWNTPTAEWDVRQLGLLVPVDLGALYQEAS